MCERESVSLSVCNCVYVHECVSQQPRKECLPLEMLFFAMITHLIVQSHSAVLPQGECTQQSASAKCTSHESVILFSIFSC